MDVLHLDAKQQRPVETGPLSLSLNRTGCDQVASRAVVMQHKTLRPVQFKITPATRDAVRAWIKLAGLKAEDFLFPSRIHDSPHLGTRQYARILGGWVDELGPDRADYGTHSMRRTKATLIYRRTKNLRAVQLLLGHSKLESTVRYLGIEVDDALEISEVGSPKSPLGVLTCRRGHPRFAMNWIAFIRSPVAATGRTPLELRLRAACAPGLATTPPPCL